MRTLMAVLTLGAGGAGYAYLQQIPDPSFRGSVSPFLIDLGASKTTQSTASRGSVNDLVNQVHEHTKSILDDFANQHGGHSDAPSDDAFQRLKQITDVSTVTGPPQTGFASDTRQFRSPPSMLDELQRMAFDPAADLDVTDDPVGPPIDAPLEISSQSSAIKATRPVQVVADSQEPASKTSQIDLDTSRKAGFGNSKKTRELSSDSQTTKSMTRVASGGSAKPAAEWKVIGKTTERRPMHAMHLGTAGTRTLVIAGLDGQDRVAVRWLEQLADSLSKRPDLLDKNEVLFVRAGNPDGLVRKTSHNVRGVPLNRNFPGRRYRSTRGLPNFAVPASEVETRVILDTLYTFRPRRVIHLVSTSAKSQVIFNRTANDLALALERSAPLRISPLDVEQIPGSIEDFSDGTLEAAVLSLRLSVGQDWQQTWTSLQPHVLSSVVGRPVDADSADASIQQDSEGTPIPLPLPGVDPISRRRSRRGYEELAPPPE